MNKEEIHVTTHEGDRNTSYRQDRAEALALLGMLIFLMIVSFVTALFGEEDSFARVMGLAMGFVLLTLLGAILVGAFIYGSLIGGTC